MLMIQHNKRIIDRHNKREELQWRHTMNAHDIVTWVILVGILALWIDIKGRHDDK